MGAAELKAVFRGPDLYILSEVGAWIKDPKGEISFLGIGRCRRLRPEEEAEIRQYLKEQKQDDDLCQKNDR